MDQQPAFNFFPAPVRGRTPRARHASWTGSQAQTEKIWTAKQSALLQVIAGGPKSRQELAGLLNWPISSVCSIVYSVMDRLESAGFETAEWSGGRVTRRERFAIRQ